jgi:hypothetical protein
MDAQLEALYFPFGRNAPSVTFLDQEGDNLALMDDIDDSVHVTGIEEVEVEDANNVVDNDYSDTIVGSFGLLLDEFDDYYVATGEEECDFVL